MSAVTPPLSPGGPGGVAILNNEDVTVNGVVWQAQNFNSAGATPYSLLDSNGSLRFEAKTGQNVADIGDGANIIRSMLIGPVFPYFTQVTLSLTFNWASGAPHPTTNTFNVLDQFHSGDAIGSPPISMNILPDGSGGELINFNWNWQSSTGVYNFQSLGTIPFLRNTNYACTLTYVDSHGLAGVGGELVAVVNGVTVVNSTNILTGHFTAVANSFCGVGYYGGVQSGGTPAQQDNVVTVNGLTYTQATPPSIPFSYIDGSKVAPTVAAGPQYPSLLSGYAKTPIGTWKVAGVSYAVGYPDSALPLKNPVTTPPAGCSVSGNTLTVNQDNVHIDGYDFSVNGGVNLVCAHNLLLITNCNFNGGNYKLLTNGPVAFTGQYMTILFCKLNGGFTAAGATTTPPKGLIYTSGNSAQVVIMFNYFSGSAGDQLYLGACQPLNCQWNFFDDILVAAGTSPQTVAWNTNGSEVVRCWWHFNTTRQVTPGARVGTAFYDTSASNVEFFGLDVQYNTTVAHGSTGTLFNYIFEGNPTSNKIGTQSFVGNNYADFSGANGMYQPGTWTSTGNIQISGPSYDMTTGNVVIPDDAFYVSPAGNDANPGTKASPVATLNHVSTLTSPSKPLVFVRGNAGLFTQSTPWSVLSNQVYLGYPGDATPEIDFSVGLSGNSGTGPFNNITIRGLLLKGTAATTDPILQFSATNNLQLLDNDFVVTGTMGSFHIYNPNGLRLQGNNHTAPSNNGNNHGSITINDGKTHTNNIANSNTGIGCGRIPYEIQCINSEVLNGFNVDYNNFSGWDATGTTSAGAIGISFVGAKSTSNTNVTCSFNTLTQSSGNTIPNLYGIEIDVYGVTTQGNVITDVTTAFLVGAAGRFLQNNMSGVAHSWLDDGGGSYVASSVQIGSNTVNGATISGCTTAGLCGLTPAPSGSQPLWPASAPFSG